MEARTTAEEPLSSSSLSQRLRALIASALAEKALDGLQLRMLTVGLRDDSTALQLFGTHSQDRFARFEESAAVGHLSLDDWLDAIDAQSHQYPGPDFARAERRLLRQLEAEVCDALRSLATSDLLLGLGHPVTLVCLGFRRRGEARVVAFGHLRGAGELLRVRIRQQSESDYPYAVLHQQGVTCFSTPSADGVLEPGFTRVREIAFADMEQAMMEGDEIVLRLRSEAQTVKIGAGMPDPDAGDIAEEEVQGRLLEHFRSRTDLFFDPRQPPDPDSGEEYAHWVRRYFASGHAGPNQLVRLHAERFGVDAARTFVGAQPSRDKWRTKTLAAFAKTLADNDRWAEALEVAGQIPVSERAWLHNLEARVLLMLGRFEEAVASAEAQAARFTDHEALLCAARCLGVLALDGAGRFTEAAEAARTLVSAFPEQAMAHYALAHALHRKEPERAAEALSRAIGLANFDDKYVEQDFAAAPPAVTAPVLERRAVELQRAEQAAALAAVQRSETPRRIELREAIDEWTDGDENEVRGAVFYEQVPVTPAATASDPGRDGLVRRAHEWIVARLADVAGSAPEFRVGALRLQVESDRLALWLEAPRSRVRITRPLEGERCHRFRVLFDEWAGDAPRVDLPSSARADLSRDLLDSLRDSPGLAAMAAARVLLVEQRGRGVRVRDTLFFDDRPWQPLRSATDGLVPFDFDALLACEEGWKHIDRVVAMAKASASHHATLLKLVRAGHEPAHFAAFEVADVDLEATVAAFIAAGEAGHLTNSLAALLKQHVDQPGVRPILEAAFASDDPWVMLPAARGLDRTESDRVVAATRKLLTAGGREAYHDADAFLEGLDSRLPELAEPLLAAIESGEVRGDALAALAGHLLRAGHASPPRALVRAATEERQLEHVADRPPAAVCTVARRWLAKLLRERVAELCASDDRAAPLWLPDYAPEPHASGWRHFFAEAWPELHSAGLLPFFVTTLAAHSGDDERWNTDRLMMPAVLAACVKGDRHLALAVVLAQAMARDGSGMAQRDAKLAEQVLAYKIATQAKSLIDAGDLDAARSVIESLRQAEVRRGPVLVSDAYLLWKEVSAEAALTRVDAALQTLGCIHRPIPDSDRAALLNLAGHILGQEGRWTEALPRFMDAAEADGAEVIYLDNIAAALHALGRTNDAVTWAKKALAAGSRAKIVATILGET